MSKDMNYDMEICDVSCDNCGHYELIQSMDFTEINQRLKDQGWIPTNIDGEFVDFCSEECKKEY